MKFGRRTKLEGYPEGRCICEDPLSLFRKFIFIVLWDFAFRGSDVFCRAVRFVGSLGILLLLRCMSGGISLAFVVRYLCEVFVLHLAFAFPCVS